MLESSRRLLPLHTVRAVCVRMLSVVLLMISPLHCPGPVTPAAFITLSLMTISLPKTSHCLRQTVNMETVDISGVKIFVTRLKIFSPLQAVCGGSVEGLVQKNRLSSTSSKDSGHSGGSMDRASTGSEQSQDHE